MVENVKFARSSRKHRIGKAHVLYVMEHNEPTFVPAERFEDDQYVWIGKDDRGVELEIAAAVKPDCLLVIHVMPTAFRK